MSKFLTKPPAPPAGETLIIPVGVEKFTLPEPPNFTIAQACLSALSLLGLTVVADFIRVQLSPRAPSDPPPRPEWS